jgi:RNA polymerase primary sigma factor
MSSAGFEIALIAGVLAGNARATARFINLASPILWSVVRRFEPEAGAESAFLQIIDALKSDGYARLRAFDGRGQLSTYLALVARDVLSAHLANRLAAEPGAAWRAFEGFFQADFRRRIAQRFPREQAMWDDIYQDLCLKLIEDDFRRVRAYDGHGSFISYILTVADRILIDTVRRHASRRRLPGAVARLSDLHAQIYIAVVWEGCPAEPKRLADALRGRIDPAPDLTDIGTALKRLAALALLGREKDPLGQHQTVPLDAVAESTGIFVKDGSPNPEERLLLAEEERWRADLISAVTLASADLPPEERCYLQMVLSSGEALPPREIARIMGCTAEDVYRIRQRTTRWIGQIARGLRMGQTCPPQRDTGDLDDSVAERAV